MIEINLLPGGAGKSKKARTGSSANIDVRSMIAGLRGRISDPYLLSALASVAVAALVVGGLYTLQQRRESELAATEQQAVADSTRYANYLTQRRSAEATRDTVLRQINVIRAIDGDRYVWPHVLDEVSSAMPEYTWLTSLKYSGQAQGMSTPTILGDSIALATAAAERKAAPQGAAADTGIVRDVVQIAIEGETVDIEAITRFMRQLEASPFVSDVQLGKSVLAIVDGSEVTSFTLQARFVRQDSSSIIRRVPLVASVAPIAGN